MQVAMLVPKNKFAGNWIINTHNGIPNRLQRIKIEEYPAVKRHLDKYYTKLKNRATKGDTPYNLRSCAYLEDFYKPKVIWKRIGSLVRFSYDDKGCFGLDSTCFIASKHAKFLSCILNSKLGHFLLKNAPRTGTGDLIISVQAISPIPVPKDIDETPFEYLVDKLLKEKDNDINANVSNIEEDINRLVYSVYDLSSDDIAIIEKNVS